MDQANQNPQPAQQSNPVLIQPAVPPQMPPQHHGFLTRKKAVAGIIILVIVIIAAGGAILILNMKKSQNLGQHPTPTPTKRIADVLIAKVGETPLYKSMVRRAAEEQYAPAAVNEKVLKQFFDIEVERVILDQEATKDKITVSPEEINTYLSQNHLTYTRGYNIAKYAILKQKISESLVQSVTAFSISFFFTSSPSNTLVANQMTATLNSVLANSRTRLTQGDKPFTVAKDLYTTYANQKALISLNGYNISQIATGNETYFVNPKVYEINSKQLLAGGYTEFYTALSSMKAGDIKTVVASEGIGGNVIKAVSVNNGTYANYTDFIAKQKKALLTIIVPL